MSLSKLLSLPKEILQTIFKFIEPKFLKLIQDIPQIRPYVLRVLYSKVTLNYFRFKDKFILPKNPQFTVGAQFRELEEPLADILMLDELRVIIEENDLPPPRKIYFNDPMDIVEAHDLSPELLKNCEIGISFNYSGSEQFMYEILVKQLKDYPYNVTRLDSYSFMDESKYGSNEKWFNSVKSLNLKNIDSLKTVFSQGSFDNLADLSLDMDPQGNFDFSDFDFKDFELIPSSLKKLECYFDQIDPEDISSIKFPTGLTELHFSTFPFDDFSPEEGEAAPVFDLSYLENLKKLYYSLMGATIKFPRSLLELHVSNSSVPLRELCRDCPDLVKLNCESFSHMTGDFPEKVTDLTIGVDGLSELYRYWHHINKKNDDSKRQKLDDNSHFLSKILSQLHHFKVSDFFGGSGEFTLFPKESDEYNFSNLKTFAMTFPYDFKVGDIPSSVTSLRVSSSKGLDFSRFKHFGNLVDVCFSGMKDISIFKCEFGPSLKYLEVDSSKIKAIDIISPNLECLVVTKTSMSVIKQSTFKVPEGLLELDISFNSITDIDDSFRFPDNLRVLDISFNELKKLGNLPQNLKKLRCGRNYFDPDEYEFSFPSSLEVFEMAHMESFDSDAYTKFFDFSICKSLKYLDLSTSEYYGDKLPLNIFPKSLVYLNLSGMEFDEIEGNFTDFENLKTLDLEQSTLQKYLEQTDKDIEEGKEEHYFGPKLNALANFNSSLPKELYKKVRADLKRGDKKKEKENKFIEI
ncbi:hypothetical protein G210_1552 [Candida maltosa Xu316]|uniref:Uncharacterized protein n=1 Tax=Candida maltosa (strain Xu316) TaxID=1245528 RepID=M3JZW9_CANMX|nr:hypothetical protein G210_1552 [Candida maltosa Xu316]